MSPAAPRRSAAVRVFLRRRALPFIAFVPVAAIASWCLIRFPGIPITHDGLGIERVEIYRRALRAGDWYPIWAPYSSNGHGSPFPLLYHRLHSLVFGVVALATGSLLAFKISVPLLLVVGAMGMRRLCLAHGARPWIAWTAGVLLMSANYTVTDWFVRGAIAEFSAFMLIPWCLHFACRLFDTRYSPFALAFASIALFYAHGMTFYFFAFIVLSVVIAHFRRIWPMGAGRLRASVVRVLWFCGVLLCGIFVQVAAVSYTLEFSGIAEFASTEVNGALAAYRPLTWYFLDPNFTWTRSLHPRDTSLEIGRWFVFLTAAILVVEPAARRALRHRAWALVIPALVFLLLQPFNMRVVFEYVPGSTRIQFPFRLLVYIVPIAILSAAIAAEAALRSKKPFSRALGFAFPLAALGQLRLAYDTLSAFESDSIPKARVLAAMSAPDPTQDSMALYHDAGNSWDRFLPPGIRSVARTPYLSASAGCGLSADGFAHGEMVPVIEPFYGWPSTRVTVHGTGCVVHLNQFLTPLIEVGLSSPGLVHTADDGTTLIDVPVDGTILSVRERSIFTLASKWLRQQNVTRP